MKVLLVDVDSKIPNLALMKLSTYYKNKGYDVELKRFEFSYYPERKRNKVNIDASIYSKVFVSIIFPINKNTIQINGCEDVSFGGTGYDLLLKLPEEIDDCVEDYSIYPDNDTSYGFITRGCIRNCYFCFVPKKEGMLHEYRNVEQIVKHKKVKFMDNNFLAYNKCEEIMEELIEKKIKCSFNQGLDLRLITERKAELLSKLNYSGEYFFAFDDIRTKDIIFRNFEIVKKYITKEWKIKFFIYCNQDMEISDIIYRIEWCKENKCLPYLMRDINCWDSKNKNFYIDLAAWCNQPSCFKKMTFKQFMDKRTNNIDRRKRSVEIYGI